jgi:hypothetical protein
MNHGEVKELKRKEYQAWLEWHNSRNNLILKDTWIKIYKENRKILGDD